MLSTDPGPPSIGPPRAPAITDRLARIDVLRGVAILLVFTCHMRGSACGWNRLDWNGLVSGTATHPGWWHLLLYPLSYGGAGVALFFVLSGYVIHRSYLRAHLTWGNYAARRFWRIYPAYFVALLGFAIWTQAVLSWDFVLHAALLHNIRSDTFFGINGSFWSLAVESQLYLLYPLAIVARRKWGAIGMLALGIVASTAWRIGAATYFGPPDENSYHIWMSPLALWPDWLLGAYLAEEHASGRRVFRRPAAWALCSFALWLATDVVTPLRGIAFSLASVGFAVAVEAYLHREGSLQLWARTLAAIGVCSYSLYLIHQPLMNGYISLLASLGLRHPATQLAVGGPFYLLAAIACAGLTYVIIERGGLCFGRWVTSKTRLGRARSKPQHALTEAIVRQVVRG